MDNKKVCRVWRYFHFNLNITEIHCCIEDLSMLEYINEQLGKTNVSAILTLYS